VVPVLLQGLQALVKERCVARRAVHSSHTGARRRLELGAQRVRACGEVVSMLLCGATHLQPSGCEDCVPYAETRGTRPLCAQAQQPRGVPCRLPPQEQPAEVGLWWQQRRWRRERVLRQRGWRQQTQP
jgi:hypothetical protein